MIVWFLLITFLTLGDVSESKSALTVYPGVQNYYMELRNAFIATGNSDPITSYNSENKLAACEELRGANVYLLVNRRGNTSNRIRDTTAGDTIGDLTIPISNTNDLSEWTNIDKFSCLEYPTTTWYLAYGFKDGTKFVLECSNLDHSTGHVVGILEPTPTIRDNLYGPTNKDSLDQLFLRKIFNEIALPSYEDGVDRPRSKVCSLNATEQFRLCSLAYDAYKKVEQVPGVQKHYMQNTPIFCKDITVSLTRNYSDRSGVDKQNFPVKALPCDIRVDFPFVDSSPFYLTADPEEIHSVFMIRHDEGTRKHRVFAHIPNINSLK